MKRWEVLCAVVVVVASVTVTGAIGMAGASETRPPSSLITHPFPVVSIEMAATGPVEFGVGSSVQMASAALGRSDYVAEATMYLQDQSGQTNNVGCSFGYPRGGAGFGLTEGWTQLPAGGSASLAMSATLTSPAAGTLTVQCVSLDGPAELMGGSLIVQPVVALHESKDS